MEPKILASYPLEGYIYLVYTSGDIVRRFMQKPGYGWERVEAPRMRDGKLVIIEQREQRI